MHISVLRRTTRILGLRVSLIAIAAGSSRTDNLFDYRVEGAAVSALDPQKVPILCMALSFAIVAHNVDHALQIGGHGMLRNVSRPGLPGGRHGLLRNNRLFANGAAVVETCEFAKAVGVNRMSTGQILGRLSRGKHVFAAHRTIVLVLVLITSVAFKDIDRNTHTTFRAVSEIFLASNSAKATLVTMKGFFGLYAGE